MTVGVRFSISKYEALYFREHQGQTLFPVLLVAQCLDQTSCALDQSCLCFLLHSSEIIAVLTVLWWRNWCFNLCQGSSTSREIGNLISMSSDAVIKEEIRKCFNRCTFFWEREKQGFYFSSSKFLKYTILGPN